MAVFLFIFPPNTLGYDLAVSVLTSSVFMILTIVLLSWLLNVRKRAEWRIVKERVYFKIKIETELLTNHLLNYVIKTPEIIELSKNSNYFFDVVDTLSEKTGIKIDDDFTPIIFYDDTLWEFSEPQKELALIQDRYFEFLSPEIVQSLMKIDDHLSDIQRIISLHTSEEKLDRVGLKQGLGRVEGSKKRVENHLKLISIQFKTLLLEVQKLRCKIREN